MLIIDTILSFIYTIDRFSVNFLLRNTKYYTINRPNNVTCLKTKWTEHKCKKAEELNSRAWLLLLSGIEVPSVTKVSALPACYMCIVFPVSFCRMRNENRKGGIYTIHCNLRKVLFVKRLSVFAISLGMSVFLLIQSNGFNLICII